MNQKEKSCPNCGTPIDVTHPNGINKKYCKKECYYSTLRHQPPDYTLIQKATDVLMGMFVVMMWLAFWYGWVGKSGTLLYIAIVLLYAWYWRYR